MITYLFIADLPSESDASTSSKLVPRTPDPMPIPALPKRTAGPRRKKSVKEMAPSTIEDAAPMPATSDVADEAEAKSTSEVSQVEPEAKVSEGPVSVAPSEVATPPPASPSVLTTDGEEESEDVTSSPAIRPKVDIPTHSKDDFDANLLTPRPEPGSAEEGEVFYPTEIASEGEQELEEEEDARKQRVAEKMARLGAVNPLGPGGVSPISPSVTKDEESSDQGKESNKVVEQSHVESIVPDESENKVAVLSSSGQIVGAADSSHRRERLSSVDIAVVSSELVEDEDDDVDYPMMSPIGGGSSAYEGLSEPAAGASEALPLPSTDIASTESYGQARPHSARAIPVPPMKSETSTHPSSVEQDEVPAALTAALARRPPIPPPSEEEMLAPSRSRSRTPSPPRTYFIREGAPSPPSIGERSQLYDDDEYEDEEQDVDEPEVEEQDVDEPEVESASPPPEELEDSTDEQEEPPAVEILPPPLPIGRPAVPNVRRRSIPPPPPPPAQHVEPSTKEHSGDTDHVNEEAPVTVGNLPPPLPGGRPPVPSVRRRSIPPPPPSTLPRYTETVISPETNDREDAISRVPPPLPSGRPPVPIARRSIPPPPRSMSPRTIEPVISAETNDLDKPQPTGSPPPLPAGKPRVPSARRSIPPPPRVVSQASPEVAVDIPSTSPPPPNRLQRPQQSLMVVPNSPTQESDTEEVEYMIGESPVAQSHGEAENIRKAAGRPAILPPHVNSSANNDRKEIMDDEEGGENS